MYQLYTYLTGFSLAVALAGGSVALTESDLSNILTEGLATTTAIHSINLQQTTLSAQYAYSYLEHGGQIDPATVDVDTLDKAGYLNKQLIIQTTHGENNVDN